MMIRSDRGRRGFWTRLAALPVIGASLVLILGFASCATVGREFPSSRIHQIKIGSTTKSDLLGQFGRPYRRGIEDGDSTWTYVHYRIKLLGGQTETKDLYLRFDGETVRSYTYNADIP